MYIRKANKLYCKILIREVKHFTKHMKHTKLKHFVIITNDTNITCSSPFISFCLEIKKSLKIIIILPIQTKV